MRKHLIVFFMMPLFASTMAAGWPDPRKEPEKKEIIVDSRFQNGLILLNPKPGALVPYATVKGVRADAAASWQLVQWASKYPLQASDAKILPDGSIAYANEGKTVIMGDLQSEHVGLTLAVKGSAEYGSRLRREGEDWAHLGVQSDIPNPPSLASLSTARLHAEARLISSRKINSPDYYSAIFGFCFIVQNRNPKSSGYGKLCWFSIIIYDPRYRFSPAYMAEDAGKADATHMFIYQPATESLITQSTHDGRWVTLDKDILPFMKEGLHQAWKHGYLNESHEYADYFITTALMGWEVTGIYDVEMQVRQFSLEISQD